MFKFLTKFPARRGLPVLLAGMLLAAGCRTDSGDGDTGVTGGLTGGTAAQPQAHQAALTITGCSEADILRALQAVLLAHGYQHMADLEFDKKGTFWQTALYGGWAADGVWVRMQPSVEQQPDDSYLVGCDAYWVTEHNQGVMETMRPAAYGYRAECRAILQEVQARLKSAAPPSVRSGAPAAAPAGPP